MPYLFTCPHCQTRTEVDDEYSGQAGQCVVCSRSITLPHFASGSAKSAGPGTGASGSNRRSATTRPVAWIAAAVVVLALVGVGLVALVRVGGATASKLRTGRDRIASIKNLESIALAMNAYAADHGTYPPPVLKNATGQPMHSWRVLLLPYLGEDELYSQLDLSKPWDSETNQQIGHQMPSVYRHPATDAWSYETAYVLVTGPGTLFPTTGPLSPMKIPDGKTQTILVAEAAVSGRMTMWIEPFDLDSVKVAGLIDTNPGTDLGGMTEGGVCVATADGRGHFLSGTTPPMTVQSLLSPSGGEPLADDVLN